MVVKMAAPGRSFGGVADYCLHDRQVPGEPHPESAERVEWTETRNVATDHGERAVRIMAATAEAGPELKRLAGGAAAGRKLEKPVCHYSLNWARDERPDRPEMSRAAAESLAALGLERHQALIVSHGDGQPHVHVIANRVDPESGKAAGLSRSKLRLSKWAEKYERGQGEIQCPSRVSNNARRRQGKRVQDRVSRSTGRHRREEMSPQREPREAIPAERAGWERERAAWQRAEERMRWGRYQRGLGKALGELERRTKREWSALYGSQERQRQQLGKDCRGYWGACGCGGSWAAGCERSAGRFEDARKCWGVFGQSWRGGTSGSGSCWGKLIRKRCGGSSARREKRTAAAWRGRRNGRGRRRGRTGAHCITTLLSIGTRSIAGCGRSGWSRCGRSTESRLTRR